VKQFTAKLLTVTDAHGAVKLIDADVDQQPKSITF
jgi:hypothetical protein